MKYIHPPYHDLSPTLLKKFCNDCKVLIAAELESYILQYSLVNPESYSYWICYSKKIFLILKALKTYFVFVLFFFYTDLSPCYCQTTNKAFSHVKNQTYATTQLLFYMLH